jgi:DNA-binding SARP family transcriptional activator
MRFQILGPVEIWDGDRALDLQGSKLRTVVAALLLARGRFVADYTLSELLWGEHPPTTSPAQIQTYMSRLRGLLGNEVRIDRRRPGYVMHYDADQLDLVEFERLVARGRAADLEHRPHEAGVALSEALALWRGPALAGVTEILSGLEQPRLEEARLVALEERVDADLLLGRNAVLVPELTMLVAQNPLRERLRGQLMISLHRSGRQADALSVYQDCRRRLAEELGIDPGGQLQRIRQEILVADPGPVSGGLEEPQGVGGGSGAGAVPGVQRSVMRRGRSGDRQLLGAAAERVARRANRLPIDAV